MNEHDVLFGTESALRDLLDDVLRHVPGSVGYVGRRGEFPERFVYASFCATGGANDDELFLEMRFRSKGASLLCDASLVHQSGPILAELPETVVSLGTDRQAPPSLRVVLAFVRASFPLVVEQLETDRRSAR